MWHCDGKLGMANVHHISETPNNYSSLLFLAFDFGGIRPMLKQLQGFSDCELPKQEIHWAMQSNIILFTSLFLAGITPPLFGLNAGSILGCIPNVLLSLLQPQSPSYLN